MLDKNKYKPDINKFQMTDKDRELTQKAKQEKQLKKQQ